MDEERRNVKHLAKRRQWGPAIDDTMVIFLERLWADKLEATVDCVSLTPWHEVCSTALLSPSLCHCTPLPSSYIACTPAALSFISPHTGHRLALGRILSGAARLRSSCLRYCAQSVCKRPSRVLCPQHTGQGMLGARCTSYPPVLIPASLRQFFHV
jgi:hypothetical protein